MISQPLVSPFSCKVVGVTFTAGYPDNLHRLNLLLSSIERHPHGGEGAPAIIVRNPDNSFDANACEVHIPALGSEWAMIGHLPAPVAARLAPELDAGGRWQGHVVEVLIHPEHDDRPGISIKLHRVEEDA